MTVHELIMKLMDFDSDLPVALCDWHKCFASPTELTDVCEGQSYVPAGSKGYRVEDRCVLLDVS